MGQKTEKLLEETHQKLINLQSEINDLVLIYLTDGEVGDGRDTESHMAFEINRLKENIS